MNGASKLGSIWFGDTERVGATSLAALALPMGCLIGFAMGPILVTDEAAKDPTDNYKKG